MNKHILPDIIRQKLHEFNKQCWIKRVLLFVIATLSIGFLAICILIAGDAWLRSPDLVRTTGALVLWSGFILLSYRMLLRFIFHKRSIVHIAEDYEQQFPDALNQEISSAVAFTQESKNLSSPWMQQRCIALATQHISSHQQQSLPHARLRLLSLFLILIWVGVFIQDNMRSYLLRNTLPWLNIPRPTDIIFDVQPGHLNIASGTEVALKIRCSPVVPELICQVRWNDGHQEDIQCTQENQQSPWWDLDLGPALESYSYTLRSGNAESPRFQVSVGAAAEINDAHITLRPPSYIQEHEQILKTGDTDVLRGSDLIFHARVRHFELERADLRGEHDWTLPLDIKQEGDEYIISGSWPAESRQHYSLHLWNTSGLHHQHPQQWLIRVNDDAAPVIQVNLGLGRFPMCDKLASIPLHINAKDDFGLEHITLIVGSKENTLITKEIPLKQNKQSLDHALDIDLKQWAPQIFERMWVMVECLDNAGQKSQSPKHSWYICPSDKAPLATLTQQLEPCIQLLEQVSADCHIFSNKWSDIRSNVRVDDVHSQSGDLLQVDQQLISMQRRVQQLLESYHAIERLCPETHRPAIQYTKSLLSYIRYHHLPWLRGRGGVLLASANTDINTLLDQSVIDSDILVDLLEQLKELAYASDARIGVDALEYFTYINQQYIALTKNTYDGNRFWSAPQFTNALRCHYYPNINLDAKPIHTDNRSIRIKNDTLPHVGNVNYSLKWKGEIFIPSDGKWTFKTQSDDGVQLSINNQELLSSDAWTTQAVSTFSNTLPLNKGWHAIEIRYFQEGGDAVLNISLGKQGEASKDINLQKLRSPSLSNYHYNTINHMLNAPPLGQNNNETHWQEAASSIQNILDASLLMHDWGARLEQYQFHHNAQSYSEAVDSHTKLLHDQDTQIKWETRSLSHYFNSARKLCDNALKSKQIPIKRQTRFGDLLIHIYYMQELSKTLKDWGLPYEQIAQTHRFLKRLQEQAIVLHQKCLKNYESIISNTKLPYGVRMSAWHTNNALHNNIIGKISGLEIDNHNVIWQLPALYKELSNIRHAQRYWAANRPLSFSVHQHLLQQWSSDHSKSFAAHTLHHRALQRIKQSHPLANPDKATTNNWLQLNKIASNNTSQLIDTYLNKHKGSQEMPLSLLKHYWQHALLESEHLFQLNKKNDGLASLHLALSLQQLLIQSKNTLKDIRDINDTAKLIKRQNSKALKQLYTLIEQSNDDRLNYAVSLDDNDDTVQDDPQQLHKTLQSGHSNIEFSTGHMDWQAWRTQINRFAHANTPIENALDGLEQKHQLLRTGIREILQVLLQANKQQSLRWQALAKDISDLDRSQQFTDVMGMISNNFTIEEQLQLLCVEQADYTYKRLRSFATETQESRSHLNKLVNLRDHVHSINNGFFLSLRQSILKLQRETHVALSIDHNKLLQADGLKDALWKKLHAQHQSAVSRLASLQKIYDKQLVHKDKNTLKSTHHNITKHLKVIQQYWSEQAQRQTLLSEANPLDAIALEWMYGQIEMAFIDYVILSHNMFNPQHHDSRIWQYFTKISQYMLSELSMRQHTHLMQLKSLLHQSSPSPLSRNKPLAYWHIHEIKNATASLLLKLKNHIETQEKIPRELITQSQRLTNLNYALAARLMHQQAQHVQAPLANEEHQQLFIQQRQTDDYNRRYEQQWQQAQTLVEMRAQFEDYSVYDSDQQLIIYDYFNTISTSEP